MREALVWGLEGGELQAARAGFKSQFCQLLAAWPWASYLSSKPPLIACDMRILSPYCTKQYEKLILVIGW